jgi:hypothetical protein
MPNPKLMPQTPYPTGHGNLSLKALAHYIHEEIWCDRYRNSLNWVR